VEVIRRAIETHAARVAAANARNTEMPSFIGSIILGMQRRQAQRSLLELDDRMLRDIGLTRGEIRKVGAKDAALHLSMR
jgi:uncharacterized protein YjiS (DUF1127 family)